MNALDGDIYRYMNQPIHILNQMGIMTSFSVAKKVTEEEMKKYFSNGKKKGLTDKQIGEMFRDKILKDIETALDNQKIPGLLAPIDMAKGLNKKVTENMPELNRLIMVIAHKMAEKKYDKMSLCYFINSLVNLLGLSESDFDKFHGNNSETDRDDDDDDDPKNFGAGTDA
jgi:hypothetical protein